MAESKSSTKESKSTKSDEPVTGSVTATVFVPSGPTPRDTILKTAITAVRDQIPVVYTLTPEIVDVSDPKTVDGVKGREYSVEVNYDATGVADAKPVNIDEKIETLTVPTLPDYNAAVASNPAGPGDGPGNA
jgi:hypothetical protein